MARAARTRAEAEPQRARLKAVVTRKEAERAESIFAATDEVAAFAQGLPEKFLHCREMNHNWRPFDVGRHRDGGFERTLRCVRCKTKKVQHLSVDGMLVGGTKYEYPGGYQGEPGMGRIAGEGRGQLRLESIKRIVGDLDG